MGCCFSRCRETKDEEENVEERTRLLSDRTCSNSIQSDDVSAQFSNFPPKKTDEQAVLKQILQDAATNIIDVAALGPHHIEHNEFLERKNQYTARLGSAVNGVWHPAGKTKNPLTDISSPEKILSSLPISDGDYILIKQATSKIKSALLDIKVNHKEDLIVPFKIP